MIRNPLSSSLLYRGFYIDINVKIEIYLIKMPSHPVYLLFSSRVT